MKVIICIQIKLSFGAGGALGPSKMRQEIVIWMEICVENSNSDLLNNIVKGEVCKYSEIGIKFQCSKYINSTCYSFCDNHSVESDRFQRIPE